MSLFVNQFYNFVLLYFFLLSDLKTLSFWLSYCSILFLYLEIACYIQDLNLINLLFIIYRTLYVKNRQYLELLYLVSLIRPIRFICHITNTCVFLLLSQQEIYQICFAKTYDLQKMRSILRKPLILLSFCSIF